MKYSDQQRIEKMRETTEKLLRYVEKENIAPERIFCRRSSSMDRYNTALQHWRARC